MDNKELRFVEKSFELCRKLRESEDREEKERRGANRIP
jgi:hypothetical protein